MACRCLTVLYFPFSLSTPIGAKRVAQVPTPIPVPVRPPAARLDPAEAKKQRLSRMSSTELAEEIRRRQLPSVDSEVERDRAVMASTAKRRELHKQGSSQNSENKAR